MLTSGGLKELQLVVFEEINVSSSLKAALLIYTLRDDRIEGRSS